MGSLELHCQAELAELVTYMYMRDMIHMFQSCSTQGYIEQCMCEFFFLFFFVFLCMQTLKQVFKLKFSAIVHEI